MNIKYRLLIARVKPLHQLAKVTMYNSGVFSYKRIYNHRNYAEVFKTLRDSQHGKRCFIIGNGPSLCASDLNQLVGEDCFASNKIFQLFPRTAWRPRYYMIQDRYINVSAEDLKSIEAEIVFIGDYFWRFREVGREDAICLHLHYPLSENCLRFSEDISKRIYCASTVSYSLMQIAVYMGYKEIYLLGFDNSYGYEIAPNGTVIKTGVTSAHFYEDKAPKEIVANVQGMTLAYETFRKYAEGHNIVVKNATRGGKLEVFERINFDSLFLPENMTDDKKAD